MSVAGTATHGKGKAKKTIQFKGKLTRAQWAEFKARLKALVKRHQGLKIHIAPAKKKRKKKKGG